MRNYSKPVIQHVMAKLAEIEHQEGINCCRLLPLLQSDAVRNIKLWDKCILYPQKHRLFSSCIEIFGHKYCIGGFVTDFIPMLGDLSISHGWCVSTESSCVNCVFTYSLGSSAFCTFTFVILCLYCSSFF